MASEATQRPQQLARLLATTILLLALCFMAFLLWAARPAMAMAEAQAALLTDEQVMVTTTPWLTFTPITPTAESGLILYPGPRIDPRAYAPVARAIAAAGYLVVIVPMPFNMAIFAPTRAQNVIAAYPAIAHWTIGGHSLGGVMAANFVATHPDAVAGLVLWAAYPGENDSLARRRNLPVTVIYGALDGIASVARLEAARTRLPRQTQFVAIEGGNHSQFGWYGDQAGDRPATITRPAQQARIVAATVAALAASARVDE